MRERKIAEFDVRDLPEEMSLGMRGILLKMSLEVRLRETFGSTENELETHEKLVEMSYDHRFTDGVIDENEHIGRIEDVMPLLFMSLFEQIHMELNIGGSMYIALDNEVKSALPSRMPRNPMEMLEYLHIPMDEVRTFGETKLSFVECA